LKKLANYSRVVKHKNSLLKDSVLLYNKATYDCLTPEMRTLLNLVPGSSRHVGCTSINSEMS
jgi:hypothetical protein